MMKSVTPEMEVLAALGAWTLRQARGRPEMLADIRCDVLSRFEGRYPHHKVIGHWCSEAQEAPEKDVTPAGNVLASASEVQDMTVGELIERLYFFSPGMLARGQVEDGPPGEIVGIEEGAAGVALKIKMPGQ